jgi:hypothetical protein
MEKNGKQVLPALSYLGTLFKKRELGGGWRFMIPRIMSSDDRDAFWTPTV